MARLVLMVLFGSAILYFAALGLLHTEQESLDTASATNARLQCCAGPQLARSAERQFAAAEQCPEALRVLRGVSWGIGEPAAQARRLLGGDCPAASGKVLWSAAARPVLPAGATVAVTPALVPDAGAAVFASAPAERPRGPEAIDAGFGWESVERADLQCRQDPPGCGEAGPCPPFSREALVAAADLSPQLRQERLRAWLCDADAAPRAEAVLRDAAEVLRGTASDAGLGDGEAQRLLCELPWSGLLGMHWLLGSALRCPPCEVSEEGTFCDGFHHERTVARVCRIGYAQGYEISILSEDGACVAKATEANAVVREAEVRRTRKRAQDAVARLRASLPLDADRWQELISASLLLDYPHPFDDQVPRAARRGPHSQVRDAPKVDQRALRRRLRPLLAEAQSSIGGISSFAEEPIDTLSTPAGTIARVCDPDASGSARREGVFWVLESRIVKIDGPFSYSTETDSDPPFCDSLVDLADLDGDGTPELIFQHGTGETEVVTLADPPVSRGTATRETAAPASEDPSSRSEESDESGD